MYELSVQLLKLRACLECVIHETHSREQMTVLMCQRDTPTVLVLQRVACVR